MLLHWLKYQYYKLFKDTIEVFIQPHRIELLRIRQGLRSHFKPQIKRQLMLDMPVQMSMEEGWPAMMVRLTQQLNHPDWQGATVTAVLGNHYVRYSTVPWHAALASAVERQAFLSHTFQQIFGDTAKQWDMRMTPAGYGKDSLASAVPFYIIQNLQSACQQAQLPLTAIQPHLVRTLNQSFAQVKRMSITNRACLHQERSKAYTCWFVSIQHDRLCLAFIEDGHWRLIKNILVEPDISEQIAAQLQRETINHNILGRPAVLLYWPALSQGQSLKLEDYTVVKILQTPFIQSSTQHASKALRWESV